MTSVRLEPADDATAVTATQLRSVVDRLITAGHWTVGEPEILIVADAGYDVTRLAFILADLSVILLGRLRSDRVLRLSASPRPPGTNGRASTSSTPSGCSSRPWAGTARRSGPRKRRIAGVGRAGIVVLVVGR